MAKTDDNSRHGLLSILYLLLGPCYLHFKIVYLFIFQVCVLESVRSLELELHVVVSHLMWELNFGEELDVLQLLSHLEGLQVGKRRRIYVTLSPCQSTYFCSDGTLS